MRLCDGTDWGRAIQLAALTGARRGEIIGAKVADMRWTQVDDVAFCVWRVERAAIEVKGGVQIKSTKSGRVRKLELSSDAAAVVLAQAAWVGGQSEWLFPTPGDWAHTRRPTWLSHAWETVRAQVPGCERVRLHDLRHWFATSALNQGIPLTTVSALLGHAQTSTTANIYGHSDRATQRLAVEKVAGALEGAP
jgi:integrase